MANVKLGNKIFNGVNTVKMNTTDGNTAFFHDAFNEEVVYVVADALKVNLPVSGWDGSHRVVKLTGYKVGSKGIQLGLPTGSSVLNNQRVIEAALTIPAAYTSAPRTSNNTAGYANITISAVNVPTEDIDIALFGLEECDTVTVTEAAITGVPVPTTGVYRGYPTIGNSQCDGTISWSPNDSTFKASTTYTATITLTPKVGYHLSGVAANLFTVEGASSVSNSADSGVVTAVFPATAAEVTT